MGEVFDYINNENDELEKVRLLNVCRARAKTLKLEKEFDGIIRAFAKADKAIACEYEREKAKQNETEQAETARAEAEQSDISETATI